MFRPNIEDGNKVGLSSGVASRCKGRWKLLRSTGRGLELNRNFCKYANKLCVVSAKRGCNLILTRF